MASPDVQRRLTAILCADLVGYSRLKGGSIWELSAKGRSATPGFPQ